MVNEIGIWMPARSKGGALRNVIATTVHSLECPLEEGYAQSLAGPNWFQGPATTSPHGTVGPEVIVRQVERSRVAYHVGARGNGLVLGREQCGYARFSRAQWTTGKGMRQMRNLALALAVDCLAHDLPIRLASAAELAAAARTGRKIGIIAHHTVRDGLGGTTHWDPGPHYPWDLLLPLVQDAADQLTGKTTEDDDMDATQDQYLGEVRYTTLATIAPNVLSTNGAVADIHQRVDALQKAQAEQAAKLDQILAALKP